MSHGAESSGFSIALSDVSGEEPTFSSARALREFLGKERTYWETKRGELTRPGVIQKLSSRFEAALQQLDNFEKGAAATESPPVNQLAGRLQSEITAPMKAAVFSESPLAEPLLDAARAGERQGQAFWHVITAYDKPLDNVAVPAFLDGAIRGYEFLRHGASKITGRRTSEIQAFEGLRSDLATKRDELISEVDAFEKDVEAWKTTAETDIAQLRAQDGERADKFFGDASARLAELEDLYRRKLQLEAPAEYWRQRARSFRNAGRGWGIGVLLSTVLAGGLFAWLFYEWIHSGVVLERFSAQHWQGIILLVAILSLAAFLIRTFGKLTFSAFHLQRDAEEREQLSYLYLALAKDTTIAESALAIVFQALFSRSDTGLLAGDHGPTMPGVADVLSKGLRP